MQSEEEGPRVRVPQTPAPAPWLAGREASVCALRAGLVNHRPGDRAQRGRLEEGALAAQTPLGHRPAACGALDRRNPICVKRSLTAANLPDGLNQCEATENKALKPNPAQCVRERRGRPAGLCVCEEPPFPLQALLLSPSGVPLAPPPASGPAPWAWVSYIHPQQHSHKLILQIRDLQITSMSEMDSRLRP